MRHGLMLVGPTMGGKTCCYRSLQKAMTKLHAAGNERYEKVGAPHTRSSACAEHGMPRHRAALRLAAASRSGLSVYRAKPLRGLWAAVTDQTLRPPRRCVWWRSTPSPSPWASCTARWGPRRGNFSNTHAVIAVCNERCEWRSHSRTHSVLLRAQQHAQYKQQWRSALSTEHADQLRSSHTEQQQQQRHASRDAAEAPPTSIAHCGSLAPLTTTCPSQTSPWTARCLSTSQNLRRCCCVLHAWPRYVCVGWCV